MSLVVAVTVAGAVVVTRSSGTARITILDVGQGDAILVEGSRGGRLLIDGGPDPDRLLVELDRRIPPWDRRLDAVILSHPHEDHVAGLALLLERYRVERVFEPGMRGPGPGYAAWLDRLGRPGAPARLAIAAGDRLSVDEIAMRVLWPIRGQVPAEPPDTGSGINNVSVVLLGVIGQRRFLLAGDVEQDVDPSLLTEGLPRVDLLKVAHHGSRTATTDAFLAAVRPRIAVASAGTGNPYGHPAKRTLERLAESGARIFRTDVDGSVTVSFAADGPRVKTRPRPGAVIRSRAVVPVAAIRPLEGPVRSFLCGIPGTDAPAEAEVAPRRSPAPPAATATANDAQADQVMVTAVGIGRVALTPGDPCRTSARAAAGRTLRSGRRSRRRPWPTHVERLRRPRPRAAPPSAPSRAPPSQRAR
jgi:competence protein ComEC